MVVSAKGRTGTGRWEQTQWCEVCSPLVCVDQTQTWSTTGSLAAVGITRRAYYPAAMCDEYVQASPLTLMTK